jgi:DNA-binding IclR family transcriptional regulator
MKKRDSEAFTTDLDSDHTGDRQFLVALARGLEVLKVLGASNETLGNAELADLTGLSKATVSRITYTLSLLGYVDYLDQLGRYRIGAGGISLGYSSLSGAVVPHVARPFMRELADVSGLAVAVGARTGLNMVYLGSERSDDVLSLRLEAGSTIPIESTAMGHAYLAALPEPERRDVLRSVRDQSTESLMHSAARIEASLQQVKEHGFCAIAGVWHPHVNAVGVPFVPKDGTPALAFTCGGLSNYVSETRLHDDIGPRLVEMVEKVRRVLEGNALDM